MTTTESIPPKRKRFRLSIRALMLAVLILGGVLGWVVHHAKVQREAVLAIEKTGGFARYESAYNHEGGWNPLGKNPWPKWLVERLGIDYFENVVTVKLGPRTTNAEIAKLAGLTSLETLDLNDINVTDADLVHLAQLVELKYLNLRDSPGFTGSGLAHLGGMKQLRALDLGWTAVNDLSALPDFPLLRALNLNRTPLDDSQLARLTRFPALKRLTLCGTKMTDATLDQLASLKNLEILDVRQTAVTEAGIARLKTSHPKLEIVHDLAPQAQTTSTNPEPQP